MRRADESDDEIPFGRFVQEHLGVTRRDDLASLFRGYLRQQSVSLALAQDLKMRIRLVEEHDRAAIGVHVRQKQQRLLQPPSARRDIERDSVFLVGHLDFAPFLT